MVKFFLKNICRTNINKKFLIFFLLIFILPLVSADPPFAEQGSFTAGYFVEFTPISHYENSKDLQINIHAFNISNGLEVDNSTTTCKLSLFTNTGMHILNGINMSFTEDHQDFELDIDGANFTRNGEYAYLVECQSITDSLGGFVAVEFEITPNGVETLTDGQGFSLLGIIVILMVSTIFFLIATIFIPNIPFKVFLGSMSILMLVGTIGFGVTIMQQVFGAHTLLISSYGTFFRLFIILLMGAGIALMLYLIIFAFTAFNKSRGLID